jgi:hypothetical protein
VAAVEVERGRLSRRSGIDSFVRLWSMMNGSEGRV